jgi:hypothetical protein
MLQDWQLLEKPNGAIVLDAWAMELERKGSRHVELSLEPQGGHVLVPSVSSELLDIGDDILVELHVDTHLQSDHGLVNRQGAENSIFEPECCVPWFLNNQTGSNPFYSNKKEERDRDDCI